MKVMDHGSHRGSGVRRTINGLLWALIAILLAATFWAIQWASHQPAVHSIWGEPSQKPISGSYPHEGNA
jgi:hypothetical protein